MCLAGTAAAAPAPDKPPAEGKVIAEARLRYENVSDDNCIACAGRSADAFTLRVRLGYETAVWHGFSALAELDQIWSLGDERYNSTRNGRLDRPVVADPEQTRLNRLQISYAAPFDTKFTLGRQRLLIGNQRFIGNAGWRQHEQTFDAFTIVNTSLTGLTLTYSYIDRVNRVFGDGDPVPATGSVGAFDSNSHVLHASYAATPELKFDAYALLLDLEQKGPSPLAASRLSTATFGIRAEGKFAVGSETFLLFNGEFAHQRDYADNPLDLNLDYWLVEGGVTWKGVSGLVGYQSMDGDGLAGFSTPLGTLHAFNGWAEMFLTTPANGLDSTYAKLTYSVPGVFGLKNIGLTLALYDFRTQRTDVALGEEFDGQIDVAIDEHVSALLKYASYDGAGHATAAGGWTPAAEDKEVFWAAVSYRY
ncbi:MAG: hypothetical protein IT548_01040 [Alphaproteobacteria bacterium]|nr:hypothetical protein [Alphaproteobacteria bacterium]